MPERSRLRASEAQDERSERPAGGCGQTRTGWAPKAGCRRDACLRARIKWGPYEPSHEYRRIGPDTSLCRRRRRPSASRAIEWLFAVAGMAS